MRSAINSLLIFLLSLCGCEYAHGDYLSTVGSYKGVVIRAESSFSCAEIAAINSAIPFYIDAWERDHSKEVPTNEIVVINNYVYECSGARLYGCVHIDGTVYVASHSLTMWSTYHEFCHFLSNAASDHSNKEWELWNARRAQLVDEWQKLSWQD